MHVIPSRADGEGPRNCSIASALHSALKWITLEASVEAQVADVRSLAVCAARDDSVP